MTEKRKVRQRRADSGRVRERLAFILALLALWSFGFWFMLTH